MQLLTPAQAAGLQLAPGAANLIVFTMLAWWFGRLGFPPFMALALAILFAEVPLSWWIMKRRTMHETGGRFDLAVTFPWRAKIPWWQYLVLGLPVILFGTVVLGMVTPAWGAAIRHALDLTVPAWFLLEPDPETFASMSRAVLIAMWISTLVVFAGIGGITQELYSRGFLLPRTGSLGRLAPLFNAVVFAAFHLNAPWSWPGFALLALPWAYLTWWKRSVKIGLVGHVGMLFLQSVLMALVVFGLVSPERMVG